MLDAGLSRVWPCYVVKEATLFSRRSISDSSVTTISLSPTAIPWKASRNDANGKPPGKPPGKLNVGDNVLLGFSANNKKIIAYTNPELPKIYLSSNAVTINWRCGDIPS
jgi:hypothetical protein